LKKTRRSESFILVVTFAQSQRKDKEGRKERGGRRRLSTRRAGSKQSKPIRIKGSKKKKSVCFLKGEAGETYLTRGPRKREKNEY